MPLGFHRHSNRSKQALNDPSIQNPQGSAPSETSFNSGEDTIETRSTQPEAAFHTNPNALNQQQYVANAQGPGGQVQSDRISYQSANSPARSQSTRHQSPYLQQEPQYPSGSSSVDDLGLEARRQSQLLPQSSKPQPQSQSPPEAKRKGLGIFDRMRSSRAPEPKASPAPPPPQASYNNTTGLARRLSKRQENPPVIRTSQQRNSLDVQQQLNWQNPQAAQDSRSHLPSPQEGAEDDSGLEPYQISRAEQEEPSRGAVQDYSLQQTIRPVRSDSDPPQFGVNDDSRQLYQTHHQQHLSLGQIPQHQQFEPPPQNQYQPLNQGQHLTTNLDSLGILFNQYPNPETVSQISSTNESPIDQNQRVEQPRPVSVQSNGQSPTAGNITVRQEYPNRTTSIQAPRPLSQYNAPMAPPPTGQQPPNRRSNDSKQTLGSQGPPDSRDGPPPGYQQRFQSGGSTPTAGPGQSPIPPGPSNNQGPNYRGGPPQREQYGQPGVGEQGRSTPPPAPTERDVNDAYKELLQKYKKVKGLYFDKTAQVENLQNTLANQRLSQSRTSLDDSEYMTRFQRLDGATTNLAFNIRKDWRTIPNWLAPYVNQDALKVGKQEMTAVGRACISRFLVDEIFNRTFHPGLESDLSTNLKTIEQNIRRFSPPLNSQEESESLTAKVVQWRLATLEGLRDVLSSPESEKCKREFSRVATSNLAANLINYLGEPVPAGIEDSAHMIIELAVSIAANLPLESRDISIIYPMPGDLFQPLFMKVGEAGVPPLENPGADAASEDTSSTNSGDKDEAKDEKEGGKLRKEKTKSGGMLQAMMGSNTGPAKGKPQGPESEGKKEDAPQKVRFAGFVGVEVRGRQMLGKAPVWIG